MEHNYKNIITRKVNTISVGVNLIIQQSGKNSLPINSNITYLFFYLNIEKPCVKFI